MDGPYGPTVTRVDRSPPDALGGSAQLVVLRADDRHRAARVP